MSIVLTSSYSKMMPDWIIEMLSVALPHLTVIDPLRPEKALFWSTAMSMRLPSTEAGIHSLLAVTVTRAFGSKGIEPVEAEAGKDVSWAVIVMADSGVMSGAS